MSQVYLINNDKFLYFLIKLIKKLFKRLINKYIIIFFNIKTTQIKGSYKNQIIKRTEDSNNKQENNNRPKFQMSNSNKGP